MKGMKLGKLGIIAALAAGLALSACAKEGARTGAESSSSPSGTSTAGAASAEPAKPSAEPVKLSLMMRADTYDADNAFVPLMEEATNTKLDYQVIPSSDYVNKRNVVMASGDFPNVIKVNPFETAYSRYLEEKLLQPLDDYIDKYPAIKDAFTAEQWETVRNPKDGHIYVIPRFTGLFPVTIAYRKDWADKLGIPEPKTTGEFRDMLKAFKEHNPDNVKDFIPFTPNSQNAEWINPFFSAYGVDYMAWIPSPDNPDRLILANTLPAFKDALIYVRDLRKDGLFDNTWLLNKDRGLFKFYAGQVGSTTDWPQYQYLRLEAVRKVHPNGEIAYINGLTGPDGIRGGTLLKKIGDLDIGAAVTSSAGPEQVEAFFRLVNWQYTDGYDIMKYGVEGINYDVVDGKKVIRNRDEVIKNNPKYHPDMMSRVFQVEPPRFFSFTEENYPEVKPDGMAYVKGVLDEAAGMVHVNYLVNQDDPVIMENIANIKKSVDEAISKIVLDPNSDIDKVYAEYMQNLKNNKLDEVTEAVNRLNSAK